MKNRFLIICILLVFNINNSLKAQEDLNNETSNNFCLLVSPQHAFIGSLRVGIDKQIGSSSSWIVLSPSFISSYNDELWSLAYDRKIGGGLTLSHRYYVNNPISPKGVYLQYGLVYNYNQLQYEGLSWITTNFDGTEAITTTKSQVKDHIHQYGFDLLVGFQAIKSEKLLLDFYLGIGHRNSKITTTAAKQQSNSGRASGILAPHYQGMLPLAGMRIGIWF